MSLQEDGQIAQEILAFLTRWLVPYPEKRQIHGNACPLLAIRHGD
jgi:hypothetical protein